MPEYRDIADMDEDNRIHLIGLAALERPGKTVAFCVDDIPGKPERYIEKLKAKFPSVKVVDRFQGPTPNIVSVIVTKELS